MTSELDTIERTYRAYFAAFQSSNPRAVLPYYHVPCVFLTPASVTVLASVHDVEHFFERMLFGLRTRGYARSELSELQLKQVGDELAMINVRGARYKADGTLLEPLSALYTMRRQEGAWRIATAMTYDPARPLDLA